MDTDSIANMEARVAARAAATTDEDLAKKDEENRAARRRSAEAIVQDLADLGAVLGASAPTAEEREAAVDALERPLGVRRSPSRLRRRSTRG